MDSKYIEQLLERYWQCETTLEEEAKLRAFFTKEVVPAHLLRYRELFVYEQLQQEERLGDDFDARVLAQIEEAPVVKAKRLTLVSRCMPLFRAAAIVVLVLSLGNVMQHSFFGDAAKVGAVDTVGDQIVIPAGVSDKVVVAQDNQKADSLKRADKEKKKLVDQVVRE